jgi:Tfp pilus assembly protein PilE
MKNRGFVTLLMELVGLAILGVMLAIALPNLQRLQIASDQRTAAQMLQRIGRAETYHSQLYNDGFRSLGVLSQIGFPASCEASNLLSGADAQPMFSRYTFTFTGATQLASPHAGCTTAGFTSYTVTATPVDVNNKRNFYLDQTGVLRFLDNGTAGPGSQAYTW